MGLEAEGLWVTELADPEMFASLGSPNLILEPPNGKMEEPSL